MSIQNWLEKYVSAVSEPGVSDDVARAAKAIAGCEALFIGAEFSSAEFDDSGARFDKYYADFERRFGFHDLNSGSFYAFDTLEEQWAFRSRFVWLKRYMNPSKNVCRDLLRLAKGKDYFVVTSCVDHSFQKARFDKSRLFCAQGDLGLFQCSTPCHDETYDNEDTIRRMVAAQGFLFAQNGAFVPPPDGKTKVRVPSSLIPRCPKCGKPMALNVHRDDTFVRDSDWNAASKRYDAFCKAHETGRVVYLELGAASDAPDIDQSPFTQRVRNNPDAFSICVNTERQSIPAEIAGRSVMLECDIGAALKQLLSAINH